MANLLQVAAGWEAPNGADQTKILRGDGQWVNASGGSLPPKTLPFVASAGTNQAWTNMPAAQTELFGSAFGRLRADLAGYTQFRIVSTQAVQGAATATLRAQYSADGANFANLQDSGTTGDLGSGTGTGAKSGAWVTITPFARADVHLRLLGLGGDGTADPAWRFLALEVKP